MNPTILLLFEMGRFITSKQSRKFTFKVKRRSMQPPIQNDSVMIVEDSAANRSKTNPCEYNCIFDITVNQQMLAINVRSHCRFANVNRPSPRKFAGLRFGDK